MSPLPTYIQSAASITPMGDERETYRGLLSGQRSLKMTPVFGTSGSEVPLSCFGSIEASLPPTWIPQLERLLQRLPERPWGHAGYPIVVTSSNFGIGHMLAFHQTQIPEHLAIAQAHTSIRTICDHFAWGGEVSILSHACVSADIGMLFASRLLHHGAANEVLCFSFDFLSPFVSGGFYSLKILNPAFPAPYGDQEIGSIGLGDGAAFAVLSLDPSAFAMRFQQTYNEMFHMTANQPDGAGFREALTRIRDQIDGRRVWVKGHGTGTRDAGKLEAESVREIFPDAPLVGWKGGIGHTLGSCGLIELTIAMQGMDQGQIPGTVGTQAPAISPNVALQPLDAKDFDGAILSSNAFGGAHASFLLTRESL